MYIAVKHLIDDSTAGGITRMLEHLVNSPKFARAGRHSIQLVKRGRLSAPRLEADVIVSHLSLSWANLPLLTTLRALHPNTPIIHVEHSYCERFVSAYVEKRARFDALMRICMSVVDRVVAVSNEQGDWMVRRRFCSSDKLSIIEPSVDLDRFLEIAPRRSGKTIRVGAIGRLDCQKGFDILIEGFKAAQRKDLELHIYGEGPDEVALRAQAADNTSIVFHGFTPDVPIAMESCDIIAMPSRWEPFGLVAIEAMAASRPVMTAHADGLTTHIRNGAFDIGENSVRGWTEALRQMDVKKLAVGKASRRDHASSEADRFFGQWTQLLNQLNEPTPVQALAA